MSDKITQSEFKEIKELALELFKTSNYLRYGQCFSNALSILKKEFAEKHIRNTDDDMFYKNHDYEFIYPFENKFVEKTN